MEQEALQNLISDNQELESKLTKRNEQYIFDLKKSMRAANLSEEITANTLKEMLPQLVDGQKNGKTARQLFGTVSECMQKILVNPVVTYEEVDSWKMWADNALLLLAVLAVMGGVMQLFSSKSPGYGILTLLLASMSGGYAFFIIYNKVTKYDRPGADKSKKPGFWKSGLIMIGATTLWVLIFSVAMLIPPSINIVMDPVYTIILGAAAFGLRYYLKKKYHIQGNFFMGQ